MFGFLKDKLKKTVEKFSKGVDEQTEEIVPTEEQKKEIIEEIKKEDKGFFQKLKEKFSGSQEENEDEVELEEKAKEIIKEDEEIKKEKKEIKEKKQKIQEEIKKEKKEIKEIKHEIEEEKEEIKKLEKEEEIVEEEKIKEAEEEITEKNVEAEEKIQELKEDIIEKEEQEEDIEEKIAEGEKEIDALTEKEEAIEEKEEEIVEEKKGFFAKLKDKLLHKEEEVQETKEEAFEATGEELKEFKEAFQETERKEIKEEEDIIPVVTKDEEGKTKFELREKPTATGKKKTEKEEEKKVIEETAQEESKGIWSAVKDTIFKTSLSEEKFDGLFWDIEVALLESNVAVEVIELIKANLKRELCQKKILRGKIEEIIMKTLKTSVEETFNVPQIDFIAKVKESKKENKPYVVVFVGINGSGKTTTIGKMIQKLKDNKLTCVVAAGDTFRAAAIQQLEEHTTNLGVKIIKHDYGSDPAAVGFDAIKYAKAHKIDCVLIDTAGRLHSNTNLMDEMKKIIRVSDPDLKVFIGEAITGNDCVEQARRFNEAISIDGVILAKADIDEKGGAALSVSYVTQKPILYLGVGQEYKDLEEFNKDKMIELLGLA